MPKKLTTRVSTEKVAERFMAVTEDRLDDRNHLDVREFLFTG